MAPIFSQGSSWLVVSRSGWDMLQQQCKSAVHAADFWSGGFDEKPITMAEVQSLQLFASHTPVGERKLALLAAADRMRPEAANALLKLLEEPPMYLSLVLITESEYLLPTVRSRVQRLQYEGAFAQGSHEASSFEQWQALLNQFDSRYDTDREQLRELLMYQPLLHSTIQQSVVLEGFRPKP